MLHLAIDQPDIASAARWYLEPVDYVSMRFTGATATVKILADPALVCALASIGTRRRGIRQQVGGQEPAPALRARQ